MKFFFLILVFSCFLGHAQDLEQIRKSYPPAVESAEITKKLNSELSNITSNNDPVSVAYKGAVLTLMAKFAKSKKDKKKYFKEGVSLIENAVSADSKNIEIRYIRLSVQENSPKFLGYHKNIEEDKQFILKNFAKVNSKDLKANIKEFVESSDNFNVAEKQALKQ